MNTDRGYGSEADSLRLYAIGCSLHLRKVLFKRLTLPIEIASYVSPPSLSGYDDKEKGRPCPIARSTENPLINEKVSCAYFNGSIYSGIPFKLY